MSITESKKIPAFFTTMIHLSVADRIRVLWHGEIIYRGVINPDPGEFDVDTIITIPPIFVRIPKTGYEESYDNES